MARLGSLLEEQVDRIFRETGFKTHKNARIKGYEIDVLVEHKDFHIAVECKELRSYLSVRNLIHQWADKNKEIGADLVLLAIYGPKIQERDHELAHDRGIILWDEETISRFSELIYKDSKKAKEEIIESLGLTRLFPEIEKRNRERDARTWAVFFPLFISLLLSTFSFLIIYVIYPKYAEESCCCMAPILLVIWYIILFHIFRKISHKIIK